jgi:hypothetical protein
MKCILVKPFKYSEQLLSFEANSSKHKGCIAAKGLLVVRELAEKFTKLLFKASK